MTLDQITTVLALVLIAEGLLPFISPALWRKVFMQILALSDGQIRFFGFVALLSALFILWL